MAVDTPYMTPGELLYKFNEAVWTKGAKGLVTLRGVYSMQDFEIRDSQYIDRLVDEVNAARINIVVTEGIRKAVKDGNVVNVTGYLDRYLDIKDGSIRLQLRVVTMDILEQSSILTAREIELSAIRHKKITDGYKPVDTLLSEKLDKVRPRVALIYPNSSIVQLDFAREVGDMADHFSFEEIRAPFSNARRLMDELDHADVRLFDVICLVRGGGADFGALESPSVLEFIVGMKTPVIAAVGHEDDTLFINEIVDKYFSTPTSLGGYFRRLAEEVERRQYRIKSMQEDLAVSKVRQDNLKKWLIIASVVAFVLIVICILLASRFLQAKTVIPPM